MHLKINSISIYSIADCWSICEFKLVAERCIFVRRAEKRNHVARILIMLHIIPATAAQPSACSHIVIRTFQIFAVVLHWCRIWCHSLPVQKNSRHMKSTGLWLCWSPCDTFGVFAVSAVHLVAEILLRNINWTSTHFRAIFIAHQEKVSKIFHKC